MVRVSKSRLAWLVALRFDPRGPFQPDDLKLMALARRMLLGHRQHVQTYDKLKDTLFGLIRCLTFALARFM
jgi:hypothetical protein